MWCRVLLFVIALTCTFQREITADTDDVLCVVILSGLQKDDLDVNLLDKLQRHNVNIDDMNNWKNIEKCILRSSSDRSNETVTEIVPTKNIPSEQLVTQGNYNINGTRKVTDIPKENDNKTNLNTSEKENNANVTIPSYENLVNLWITLNNKNHQNNEIKPVKETEKGITVQLPLSFEKEPKTSQAKNLDFIHQMFESYISATKVVTTTVKPTTAIYQQQNQVDTVSQQIMKILNSHDKTIFGRGSAETQSELTNTHKTNYNVNETMRVQGVFKDNENKTKLNTVEIENSKSRNTHHNPNFDNFVEAWIKFNKTSNQDNKYKTTKVTEKNITIKPPVIFNKETINSQATDLDFINRIIRSYLSQKSVTTMKPNISEKQIDTVSKQIKEFLKKYHDEILVDRALEETIKNRNADTNNLYNVKSLTRNSDSISNPQLAQKCQLNFPGPLVSNLEDIKKLEKNLRIFKTRSNPTEQMPITLNNKDTNVDPQSKYIELLKAYMNAKYVQTLPQQPTTTPKHIDIILQEIKELLESNDTNYHKYTSDGVSEHFGNKDLNAYKTQYNNDKYLHTHKSVSIQSNNKLRNQQHMIIPNSFETNSRYDQLNNIQILQSKNNIGLQRMPITFDNKSNAESNSRELDNIFHMLENYIATKGAETTISVPTTPRHIDVIAQKVKDFLDRNDNKYRRIMVTREPPHNQNAKVAQMNDTDKKLLVTRKIDYMKEIQRQANQLKMADSLEISAKNGEHSNNSQIVQHKVLKVNKSNDTIKTERKPLTEDLIREITEKVKASVLKDLQKQMSTTLRPTTEKNTIKIATTKKNIDNIHSATTGLGNFKKLAQRFKKESNVETTTESPLLTTTLQVDQNKLRTATNALENFIKLFEQFKHVNDRIITPNDLMHTFTQKGKTKNEFHGPINVVYPTLLPLNYAYNGNNTRAVSPIFVNPYGFQINNPMVQKTRITNEINKFQYSVDPQNNIASKMEHAMQAAVIQTDDAQVPLLGIPVSKSVSPINQNIIVTTKHPSIKFKDIEHRSKAIIKKPIYQDYTVRGHGKYDTESDRQSDIDLGRQSDADIERDFNTDLIRYYSDMERAYGRDHRNMRGGYPIPDYKKKTERSRQWPRSKQANLATDNFYKEYLSNIRGSSGKTWYRPEYSQETKRERFHEKLERPDEWQYRFKTRETPKKDKRMNVASRQQLSINDLKKNNRFDSHYINFLKSQQKVNDLLEKMLTSPDRAHSVEAI